MQRPRIIQGRTSQFTDTNYTCPHCGVLQVSDGRQEDMGAVAVRVLQCRNCRDISISAVLYGHGGGADRYLPANSQFTFFPATQLRPAKNYRYCLPEVFEAYEDACKLFSHHAGASGAYARRALELILDNSGYEAKSLADSIALAEKESDPDKRLSRALLLKLNYVKEIGNFALHIRRDDELAIVPISEEEVSACLETIEELITFKFEDPGDQYEQTVAINEKLRAAGKKEMPLPPAPAAFGTAAAGKIEKLEPAAAVQPS